MRRYEPRNYQARHCGKNSKETYLAFSQGVSKLCQSQPAIIMTLIRADIRRPPILLRQPHERDALSKAHAYKMYAHAYKTYAHAYKTYAHAYKTYAHAYKAYAHAYKAYAHAYKTYAHAYKTYAHAYKTYAHAYKMYAHAYTAHSGGRRGFLDVNTWAGSSRTKKRNTRPQLDAQ
jgi:hypothetical protein